MDLTGFRTVIAALVGGPLSAFSVKYFGSSLDPATQLWLVGVIMTVLMLVMRIFTKTPIAQTVPQALLNAQAVVSTAATQNTLHGVDTATASVSKPQGDGGKIPVVKMLFLGLLITPLLTLVGCQALGITKPLTFNDQLGVGYGTATAVLTTTDTLLAAGKIGSATAKNIEAQDVNLKAALDIAAQVEATNASDGGNQLQAALTAINALSTYLATLQPTPAK